MEKKHALSICAALGISAGLIMASGPPVLAKGKPILVNAPADEIVTRRISYADLNVAVPAGQRALERRVRFFVKDLCSEVAGGFDSPFMFSTDEARCTQASWEQARPQMDRAIERAREIAFNGRSSIPLAAATIVVAAQR